MQRKAEWNGVMSIEYSYAIVDGDLVHYGIKGQKWGVRNYQNKDGSLTAYGKKRYSYDQNNYEKRSSKQKLTTKQKVAIGIGVASVVAVGAHFAHKYYQMNADTIIKKGKEFQHMGRIGEDLSKPFYASHLRKDNKMYAKNNLFGSNWKTQKTMIANKDIKIAGKKVTLDTFSEWVSNSPIAKEKFQYLDTSKRKNVKRAYYSFNKNLTSPDIRDKKVFNDFYQSLVNKGYDAIRDMNDQTQSGARSPIIIFNKLNDIMTTKVKDL